MTKKKKKASEVKTDRPRCADCGLAVVRTPYERWKHCANRQTGAGCGKEPNVVGAPS